MSGCALLLLKRDAVSAVGVGPAAAGLARRPVRFGRWLRQVHGSPARVSRSRNRGWGHSA